MTAGKMKRKGKSKFLMIEGYVYRSAAFQALNPNERTAYEELKWRYDGFNNGRIGISNRELAAALRSSKDTARRALDGLVEKGFLEKTKLSGFNVKNRVATEWRLTEYKCNVTGELSTKRFMKWQPEKKTQAHQRDAQAHQKDTYRPKLGGKRLHGPCDAPVKANSGRSQAHQRDTYNIPRQGGVTDAA